MSKRLEMVSWIGQRIGKPPGWERIVRRLAPAERWRGTPEVAVIRDGALFLASPWTPIGWNVICFGGYEPELRDIFRHVLRPGAIAIDIGANIGWHTLLMAGLVSSDGRVVAIEANPSVCTRLRENLSINGLTQVDVVPIAVADAERTVVFRAPAMDDPDAGNGHVIENRASETDIIVPARRLDDVVAEKELRRIDLIKIDVEGFEWPVLKGAVRSIVRFRPHIVFEFDSAYMHRGGGSAAEMRAFFNNHGYRLFGVRRNWLESFSTDEAWPPCVNFWAIPTPESNINSN